MSKNKQQAQVQISASPRVAENEKGFGVVRGESFRAYVVLGGVPLWSAVLYGDKEHQESVQKRMQADVKTKVEIDG